jgi:hypothetical protein
MATRPNPDGWKGGPEDFGFITTQRGHITHNVVENADEFYDRTGRNAAKSLDDFDYGQCGGA